LKLVLENRATLYDEPNPEHYLDVLPGAVIGFGGHLKGLLVVEANLV
jgi:hypothetical protein